MTLLVGTIEIIEEEEEETLSRRSIPCDKTTTSPTFFFAKYKLPTSVSTASRGDHRERSEETKRAPNDSLDHSFTLQTFFMFV